MDVVQPAIFRYRGSKSDEGAPATSLYSRMAQFCESKCSGPRDAVYALLSFEDQVSIQPDYSLEPRQTWQQLYTVLITEGHINRLLTVATRQVQDRPMHIRVNLREIRRFPRG